MKLKENIKTKSAVLLLLTLSFWIPSCKKSDDPVIQGGPATVIVNLLGVTSNSEELATANGVKSAKLAAVNNSAGQPAYSEEVQKMIVPFDNNLSIVAELVPEHISVRTETKGSLKRVSSTERVAAVPEISSEVSELEIGVKYRVTVYDSEGEFVAGKTYTYGGESEEGFALNGGETYTFVTYSVNSETEVPSVTEEASLSEASIDDVSEDLMYVKTNFTPSGEGDGINHLDVILKHQFSQITTNIELDGTMEENGKGVITAISSAAIKPMHSDASINLSSGEMTYGSDVPEGVPVVFQSLGDGKSITSDPTVIISAATTTGTFTIGSITIGGVTKENIAFNNLKINPGRKYNLNIKIQSPCTELVTSEDSFDFDVAAGGEAPHKEFNAPGANFGFTFDVTEMDNSFNLTINGTALIKDASNESNENHEIQFQDEVEEYPRNIRFADGTIWGAPGISEIYSMQGSADNPIIRVVITATGDVFMYGSKSDEGGDLQPLELTGGFTFNKITWNSGEEEANRIVVSQTVTGATVMKGSGYGMRIIPCTN